MYRVTLGPGLHHECVVIGECPRMEGQMTTSPTEGIVLKLVESPVTSETPQFEIRVLDGRSHFVSIDALELYE